MTQVLANGVEIEVEHFQGLEEYLAEWRRGITPAPNFLVSEWADERRILDKPFTKSRTRWHTTKVPYTEEIMDCFSPQSPVQRVYWMKPSQVAGSETGNNVLGHSIEVAPGMLMYVNPTKSMTKRMSARIQALIDTSPSLQKLVLPARSRDSGNTQFMKKYPGGQMVFVGAQSATDLRSYACQLIILDEKSQTGEAWDRIHLGDIDDQPAVPLPAVGGTVRIDNPVEDQLEYVSENDYSPDDGRDDEEANDPLELLKAVPTTLVMSLTQLSGRDVIEQVIDLPVAAPWSGPKQYGG